MDRIVLIVAAGCAALMSWSFVLGLRLPGQGWQGAIGWGAIAAGMLVHPAAVAVLLVVGRRARLADVPREPGVPAGRFGARATRNADRAVPIAGAAFLLLLLSCLAGPPSRANPAGAAALARIALSSAALGFNLVALGIEAISARSQLRLLRDASSTASPPTAPPGAAPPRLPDDLGTPSGRPA